MKTRIAVSRVSRWLSVAALTIWSGACRDANAPTFGEGEVEVETDRAIYAPRDSIHLAITNTGAETVLYAFCPVYLERLVGSFWTETGSSPLGPFGLTSCETPAQWVDPGGAVAFSTDLPGTLSQGTFRVRFDRFRNYDTGLPLRPEYHVSNTFELRESVNP